MFTYQIYECKRNHLQRVMREEIRRYAESLLWYAESCPKRFFVYLNRRCRATYKMRPMLVQDGRLVKDSLKQAETLANQYQSVFTAALGTHTANLILSVDKSELNILQINQSVFLSELSMSKTGKSFKPNGHYSQLNRELVIVIAGLSFETINKSLRIEVRHED